MGNNVIELNRTKVFNVTEAEELLPVVRRITDEYYQKIQALMNRLEGLRGRSELSTNEETANVLEKEINEYVNQWQTKMEKLGAHTKGLWIADFDCGDGYFCWKYPEEKIRYWHRYNDGFRGRVLLEEKELSIASDVPSPDLMV